MIIQGSSLTAPLILKIPVNHVENGVMLSLPNHNNAVLSVKKCSATLPIRDDLNNYVINFLQWYFVILQMKDCIHEGDIFRTNTVLKMMIPFFYSHSKLSKYFVECIDYIIKTECILPSALALQVRAGSFVNPNGGRGKNKAADLQKENEVKLLKELIKGLGANKTENAIIKISQATPVFHEISANYDNMCGIKEIRTTHKARSSNEDIMLLLEKIAVLDPWTVRERELNKYANFCKSPFNFDLPKFKEDVMRHANRLLMCLPYFQEGDDNVSENVV
jgi:hypothetical protein